MLLLEPRLALARRLDDDLVPWVHAVAVLERVVEGYRLGLRLVLLLRLIERRPLACARAAPGVPTRAVDSSA